MEPGGIGRLDDKPSLYKKHHSIGCDKNKMF